MMNDEFFKNSSFVIYHLFKASLVGYTKFPAALFAAAGKQFAAVFGCHAFAEPVFVFTGAAGWLIGTFHRLSCKN